MVHLPLLTAPSSAGLSSTPLNPLGSWCCIPSSWLILPEGPTVLPQAVPRKDFPCSYSAFSPSFPSLTFLLHMLPSTKCMEILAALFAHELGSGQCHCRFRWSFGFSCMFQSPWSFQEYFIDVLIWITLFTKILTLFTKIPEMHDITYITVVIISKNSKLTNINEDVEKPKLTRTIDGTVKREVWL